MAVCDKTPRHKGEVGSVLSATATAPSTLVRTCMHYLLLPLGLSIKIVCHLCLGGFEKLGLLGFPFTIKADALVRNFHVIIVNFSIIDVV